MSVWLQNFAPIAILLVVVGLVVMRLPKIEIEHSPEFRRRRALNWLPLGLTYAFLYMGRYNLTVAKSAFENIRGKDMGAMMGNDAFGLIFGIGTVIYGFSFVLNGPLTDRLGGRFSILASSAGTGLTNLGMAAATWSLMNQGPGSDFIIQHFTLVFALLYGVNMYFQSFGAVAIVKVNAAWFHVRERGVFGAIFGILISLGIYFAFDWGALILKGAGLVYVFLVPAVILLVLWVVDLNVVRDSPADAGLKDFDTADASSGDDGPRLGAVAVLKLMLQNPVIMTIAGIEFCSGFLRQAIMQWYRTFAKQTDGSLHLAQDFVYRNWGLLLCVAGILGGVVAGVISDHVFHSRRGPVAFLLYCVMLVGAVVLLFTFQAGPVPIGSFNFYIQAWLVIVMSMAVIGVHGMLSGTASMDFGGRKNVGVAVGIIDGFVYLGTAVMSFTYGFALPKEELDEAGKIVGAATDPANWRPWALFMIPVALVGTFLARRVWHARPQPKGASAH
ncbi:MAG: MFS transporter [Deltaproteobacteria bacterium]|nr:MFS transporter [Deltaproteobacteria bacterium]